jgi:hypothetical protein
MGVRLLEEHAISDEAIDLGRPYALVSVGGQAVGAQGID